VLAAGVWSRELAAQVGVDLPVFSSRSHIVLMHPQGELPRPMPVISDYAGSFYTRPELGKLLVGLSNSEEPVSYRTDVDWEFIYTTLHSVIWRMPFIEQAGIGIAWAGLIEYTPDKHPVIGPVPEVEGLIICAGFSGHGFMHGPVAGRLVAELITAGAARTIDITPLDIRRFDRNPPAGLAPIRELLSYTRKAILDYRRGRSQG
jgi:sarcosine oxidase, subunit beta